MTRKITPAQLDEIEAVAKEATPGPLRIEVESIGELSLWSGDDYVGQVRMGEDAKLIAMMDPATTLALVAEVRELHARVERVEAIHRPIRAVLYPGTSERVMEVCAECRTRSGDWHPWPCPTIRALDGEES